MEEMLVEVTIPNYSSEKNVGEAEIRDAMASSSVNSTLTNSTLTLHQGTDQILSQRVASTLQLFSPIPASLGEASLGYWGSKIIGVYLENFN